jgi:hypothetical protein
MPQAIVALAVYWLFLIMPAVGLQQENTGKNTLNYFSVKAGGGNNISAALF